MLKNSLAFLTGGVLSVLATLIFAKPILEFTINKDVGLGIVALAPVLIIIYSMIFGVAGGLLGIIIYNFIRYFKRKRGVLDQEKKQ